MATKVTPPDASPNTAISLPSADLVKYRFDQIDSQFTDIKQTLSEMRDTGMSKAEIMLMRSDTLKNLSEIRTKDLKQDSAIAAIQTRADQLEGSINTIKWFAVFFAMLSGALVTYWITRHP